MQKLKLLIIAGEPSGDLHASHLVQELEKSYDIELYGTGGIKLKELGQIQTASVEDMAVIGFDGVFSKIPFLLKIAKQMANLIETKNIDMVILVDYAGFNLRFAKMVKKRFPNIPIVNLIAPQVWIWNYSRVKILKQYFDKVLCILPFEEKILKNEGIDAVYIGNPVVNNIKLTYKTKEDFFNVHNLDINKPLVGLIPGSRKREINDLLPVMLKAAKNIEDTQFLLAAADSIDTSVLEQYLKEYKINIKIIKNETIDIMKYSSLLWICSGTATLEAAILTTPMIIMYQTSFINYIIILTLTDMRMVGLPNIISEKINNPTEKNITIVPEMLKNRCNSKMLEHTHKDMINNLDIYRKKLKQISDLFTEINPMQKAKEEIIKLLNRK